MLTIDCVCSKLSSLQKRKIRFRSFFLRKSKNKAISRFVSMSNESRESMSAKYYCLDAMYVYLAMLIFPLKFSTELLLFIYFITNVIFAQSIDL